MTDKPARPALKNIASAPVIYFDAAPALGQANGVVSIVLSAVLLSPMTDAQVVADGGCVAHLRGTPAAMKSLREAIDKALGMVGQGPGEIDLAASPAEALERRLKAMQ
jgi:hypothetical protein